MRLRPDVTEVPGLYLAGEDVIYDGILGAIACGLFAASKVIGVLNPRSLKHAPKVHTDVVSNSTTLSYAQIST